MGETRNFCRGRPACLPALWAHTQVRPYQGHVIYLNEKWYQKLPRCLTSIRRAKSNDEGESTGEFLEQVPGERLPSSHRSQRSQGSFEVFLRCHVARVDFEGLLKMGDCFRQSAHLGKDYTEIVVGHPEFRIDR
jgi:hypothetical protein